MALRTDTKTVSAPESLLGSFVCARMRDRGRGAIGQLIAFEIAEERQESEGRTDGERKKVICDAREMNAREMIARSTQGESRPEARQSSTKHRARFCRIGGAGIGTLIWPGPWLVMQGMTALGRNMLACEFETRDQSLSTNVSAISLRALRPSAETSCTRYSQRRHQSMGFCHAMSWRFPCHLGFWTLMSWSVANN